jgi:DNA-directed RNA polymerase subunit RPC12/RpoP
MDKPIMMSDNYRSSFLIRVKKTNGKTCGVWFEISSHNEKLATTLEELQKLITDMKLEEEIPIGVKPQQPIPKVYVCMTCKYSMPAFPEHPQVGRYYCPNCGKWTSFEKK